MKMCARVCVCVIYVCLHKLTLYTSCSSSTYHPGCTVAEVQQPSAGVKPDDPLELYSARFTLGQGNLGGEREKVHGRDQDAL